METQFRVDPKLVASLATFGRELIASKDVDPLYPVLRALYKQRGWNKDQQYWFTALYLAYYNLPSALAAYRIQPEPGWTYPEMTVFPRAVARRGLRANPSLEKHLRDLVAKAFGGGGRLFERWATEGWGSDVEANYELFWTKITSVWGNGRVYAFKWSEVLKKVHNLPLAAPDMRLALCTGPKQGLCEVFGWPIETSVADLNAAAVELRMRLHHQHKLVIQDWEELETVLCNWHSYRHGHYYVGYDTDELQHDINAASEAGWLDVKDAVALYEARASALPAAYLGERNGWHGVRKNLLGVR